MLGLGAGPVAGPVRTASGTELRRHQVDARSRHAHRADRPAHRRRERKRQRAHHCNGSGNGAVAEAELVEEDVEDDFDAGFIDDAALEAETTATTPRLRRYRFRHPTASGKTIAAAGFVEAARELGVLILTHRRLLVTQFQRDLTTEVAGHRFSDRSWPARNPQGQPAHDPDVRLVRTPRTELDRSAYHFVLCDEAHTALGEKTSAAIRAFHEPLYIGMTATEQLIAKQVSDVFPASVDDLPLADAARRGLIARSAICRCVPWRRPSTRCRSWAATSRSARSPQLSTIRR